MLIDARRRFSIADAWPRPKQGGPGRITAIAVHHTAGFYYTPDASQAAEIMHLIMIHEGHVARGFGGIGYHIVVFASGRAYIVCNFDQWGANVAGENDHVLGLCAVGTFMTTVPGRLQLDGMAEGVREMWSYAA